MIVGCGARKREGWHPARELYCGPLFRQALRAAERLAPASQIRILSAKHGLLELTQPVENYDLRLGQPGAVGVDRVRDQAARGGFLAASPVVVLAGNAYADMARDVWPAARCPLRGHSMLKSMSVLKQIAYGGTL